MYDDTKRMEFQCKHINEQLEKLEVYIKNAYETKNFSLIDHLLKLKENYLISKLSYPFGIKELKEQLGSVAFEALVNKENKKQKDIIDRRLFCNEVFFKYANEADLEHHLNKVGEMKRKE